jgi:hypothetical protein
MVATIPTLMRLQEGLNARLPVVTNAARAIKKEIGKFDTTGTEITY